MRVIIVLAALIVLLALTVTATSAQRGSPPVLRGACYCRAEGRLTCVAELTRLECDRRCAEEFCDDWFWVERRPCWNWGYGG